MLPHFQIWEDPCKPVSSISLTSVSRVKRKTGLCLESIVSQYHAISMIRPRPLSRSPVSSALRISGWHKIDVQQIPENKYMNGREKTSYVQVLPFVTHLPSPCCKKPKIFFSPVCLPCSPLHPSTNTIKALNPGLILVQILNETMLICYSPPSVGTCKLVHAEPFFQGNVHFWPLWYAVLGDMGTSSLTFFSWEKNNLLMNHKNSIYSCVRWVIKRNNKVFSESI